MTTPWSIFNEGLKVSAWQILIDRCPYVVVAAAWQHLQFDKFYLNSRFIPVLILANRCVEKYVHIRDFFDVVMTHSPIIIWPQKWIWFWALVPWTHWAWCDLWRNKFSAITSHTQSHSQLSHSVLSTKEHFSVSVGLGGLPKVTLGAIVATTLATRIRLYGESVNTASRMTNGYP